MRRNASRLRRLKGHTTMEDFEKLGDLIRLVLDAKGCQSRLDALTAATVKAKEATARAERAQASLASARTEQAAELAKAQDEVKQYHETVLAKDREAYAKLVRVNETFAAMKTLDEQMRRAVMNYAGWLHIDTLQALPSWSDLDYGVLGKPRDAHLAEAADGEFKAQSADIESVPGAVAGSTLTRSKPRRGAERRLEQ
jgi:hypothetical protein